MKKIIILFVIVSNMYAMEDTKKVALKSALESLKGMMHARALWCASEFTQKKCDTCSVDKALLNQCKNQNESACRQLRYSLCSKSFLALPAEGLEQAIVIKNTIEKHERPCIEKGECQKIVTVLDNAGMRNEAYLIDQLKKK